MSRVQLRFTAAAALLLLLLPAGFLWRLPRPQALGLGRLLTQMALLQSLPALPERPVPRFWRERLGEPLAASLWRQSRRLWWQGWGRHGDAGAYLIVPLPGGVPLPAAQRPANSLLRDDLLVVAADPLALRLLEDQLRVVQRPLRGLDQRCLALLENGQAVFWKPAGLGGLSGPLAPLLQGFQEGCLALSLEADGLRFVGEASASPDAFVKPREGSPPATPPPLRDPALLLELQGSALAPLVQGLLNRQLIRDALTSRYGIATGDLELLQRLPFRLQVRPFLGGPFRAGILLQVAPGERRQQLARLLESLRLRLRERGLNDGAVTDAAAVPGSRVLPEVTWRREDGAVVGGWRWRVPSGSPPELMAFLGPLPPPTGGPALQVPPSSPDLAGALLQLRMRPAALAKAGLWPRDWPALLQQASELELASQASGRSLSRLQGHLRLGAPLPPGR